LYLPPTSSKSTAFIHLAPWSDGFFMIREEKHGKIDR